MSRVTSGTEAAIVAQGLGPIGRESAPRRICVFCGARSGADPKYARAARETGRAIALRGWGVVFGGGHVGLMGQVADAAMQAGGEVIGVIPEALLARELGHRAITRLEIVADMAVRKQRMIELSDAFVALPGGLGTLDELFEVLTLRQTHYHAKPCALYNVDGYFDALLTACRRFVAEGFVRPEDFDFLVDTGNLDVLLDRLFDASPPVEPRVGPEVEPQPGSQAAPSNPN